MRLIDAKAAERCIKEAFKESPVVMGMLLRWIRKQPTIEAEPVKHGRWLPQILLGQRVWDCSECKTLGSPQWKRCPVCEAKMDAENEA